MDLGFAHTSTTSSTIDATSKQRILVTPKVRSHDYYVTIMKSCFGGWGYLNRHEVLSPNRETPNIDLKK